jgi:hypothetical protein
MSWGSRWRRIPCNSESPLIFCLGASDHAAPSYLLNRILEEADLIAPFSFFANAASTLQECTLTYHRPMPKQDNLPMGRQKCHPFALPENKPTRTKSAA